MEWCGMALDAHRSQSYGSVWPRLMPAMVLAPAAAPQQGYGRAFTDMGREPGLSERRPVLREA